MAKRFTDTNKWSKSWFMDLSTMDKLLWIYILDTCDHAGIWEANWKLVNFMTGLTLSGLPESFNKQVTPLDGKRYFIRDFVEFQYGILNDNNNAHRSVLNVLQKYNIKTLPPNEPLNSPSQGAQDKDKDKDKVKDKDIRVKSKIFKPPTLDEVREYFEEKKYNNPVTESEKFWNFYESKGWMVGKNKMKKWHSSASNWNKRDRNITKSDNRFDNPDRKDAYADL